MSAPTRDEIVRKYKAAETAATAALESAQDLNFAIGMKSATAEQCAQLEKLLNKAFKQGALYACLPSLPFMLLMTLICFRAESWRGSFLTMFHAADPNSTDEGHLAAVEWIDDNIMKPTQNLADLRKIPL